ncbi:hypothetical protein GWD52_01710 [Enterobacteriaceae bacterium 4M9]|nr:hypothetical protein [Enterobacteriaceae bacterium 4M9]
MREDIFCCALSRAHAISCAHGRKSLLSARPLRLFPPAFLRKQARQAAALAPRRAAQRKYSKKRYFVKINLRLLINSEHIPLPFADFLVVSSSAD